jgi:hypothetical protein
MGTIGIEGDMGLWIPPSDIDQDDAWEASRKAGQHDWWSFMSFVTIPSGPEYAPPLILICHTAQSFFNQDREVVRTIKLQDTHDSYLICNEYGELGDELSEEAYEALKHIFAEYLGAEVVDDGLWLDWK